MDNANLVRADLTRICQALNDAGVNYMTIGGIAVAILGYPRYTGDIDFWYEPAISNYLRIVEVLRTLGIEVESLESLVFDPDKTFLRVHIGTTQVEFLPKLKGLDSFRKARTNASVVIINDVQVPVIGLDDLITNKEATGREEDLKDVRELRKWGKKE